MPTVTDRIARESFWLALILAGFVVLATIYSLVTPPFEASDELWHYPMVKYVADHSFGLPVQRAGQTDIEAPWRQEGGQPPLYYLMGAAATFWIDTSDMPAVRRINPHANIGEIWPDGNANMVVHDHERESFPWSGTVLAIHIVRFMSIVLGLGTVYITYRLGRELFPHTPIIGLAAATFTAFNPMFLFVSAAINNDNLSTLLASLLLLLIVRLIKSDALPAEPSRSFSLLSTQGKGLTNYILLGLVAGAGMLAKFQIGFMLPLVALALLTLSIRRRDWRPLVIGGLISGGLTILIAGWWYWRNYDLYGDATGINVFLDIVGRRAVPADLRQLWTEREAFMMSFWGFFGGVNVPMWDAVYTLFNLFAALSVAGLLYALIRWLSSIRRETRLLPPAPQHTLMLARLIAVLWVVIVFVSLISWTRQTWASQGRLWFSALAAINVWLAAGIAAWSPRSRLSRVINFGVASVAFASIAAAVPWTTIRPAYTLDNDASWHETTHEVDGLIPACFQEPETDHEALCVAAYPLAGSLRPGDDLRFSPAITVKQVMARDWSLFVHLVGEDGIIEAQRDVYPGGGLIATSDAKPGDAWNNRIAVRVPEGIYTPQMLDVYLGFYHLPSGERMLAQGANRRIDAENNRVFLGQVRLETPPGSVPNPVDVDFGGVIMLRGYEISDRSLQPGQTTVITLYSSAQQPIDTSYTVSIQIIDPDPARLTKAAQDDRPPSPPVTDWEPGAMMSDTRTLTIMPGTAPGRYRLLIRMYDDPAHPLRVRTQAGGQSEDFVWLSWIQVEGP